MKYLLNPSSEVWGMEALNLKKMLAAMALIQNMKAR